MLVTANLSQEVYDYFKDFDLSDVANSLLDIYDFTTLPQTSKQKDKQVTLNITNDVYISLYNTVGSRSKKVSLGRLFEFAYNMQVLENPEFEVKMTHNHKDHAYTALTKAYVALLTAKKYDPTPELQDMINILYQYKELNRRLP